MQDKKSHGSGIYLSVDTKEPGDYVPVVSSVLILLDSSWQEIYPELGREGSLGDLLQMTQVPMYESDTTQEREAPGGGYQ